MGKVFNGFILDIKTSTTITRAHSGSGVFIYGIIQPPIMVAVVVSLLTPSAATLIGMLMLDNLFRESLVVDRLSETAQNKLVNIVTIFLGLTVGATGVSAVPMAARVVQKVEQ